MPKKRPQKAKARAKVEKKRQKATAEEERKMRKAPEKQSTLPSEPARVA